MMRAHVATGMIESTCLQKTHYQMIDILHRIDARILHDDLTYLIGAAKSEAPDFGAFITDEEFTEQSMRAQRAKCILDQFQNIPSFNATAAISVLDNWPPYSLECLVPLRLTAQAVQQFKNAHEHGGVRLSSSVRIGALRKVLEALERGETLTPKGFKARFGASLSKIRNEVSISKYDRKEEILHLLAQI